MKKRFFKILFLITANLFLAQAVLLAASSEKKTNVHFSDHLTKRSTFHTDWNQNSMLNQYGCLNEDFDDSFCFAYNRVDGLFFGIKKPRDYYSRYNIFQLYGMVGIGLKSDRFQYELAIERGFLPADVRFSIGAEIYDLTYSEDQWIIPMIENSLAALLIHEDYQDFYRRKGYGAFISQQITRNALLKAGYYEEEHINASSNTDWALFGGDKKFRINPAIDELTLRGIYGNIQFDSRNRWNSPRRGWLIQLIGEYFPTDFGGESDFQRFILDLRRYQPISYGENINLRLRFGETAGIVPIQKYFDLGGISTLRAFDFKEFTGTRMVLGNIEYQVNWDRLDWYPDFLFFDEFNLILFADAGLAWFREDMDFQKLAPEDLHSDFGIAFSNDDGTFRLNIAKRLDRSVDAIKVTFRISRPF